MPSKRQLPLAATLFWEKRSYGFNTWLGSNPWGCDKGGWRRVKNHARVTLIAEGRYTDFRGTNIQYRGGIPTTTGETVNYGHGGNPYTNAITCTFADGHASVIYPGVNFEEYLIGPRLGSNGSISYLKAPDW